MTRDKAIAELVRIWHSPHLDLSLKAGLAEVIETLKEKNQSDSLVRDDADDCKESESKLDLIRRSDAIKALCTGECGIMAERCEELTLGRHCNVYNALSALPSAEAIHKPDYSYEADMVRRLKESLPSAEAVQGWIPCSERVPSKAEHRNDMVLVCYGNGSIRFNTYMNGWVQGFPIAWMPLPEPYKGGDEE